MRVITLEYPNMALSPNRKHGKHWTTTQQAKKLAYEQGYYGAKMIYATDNPANEPTPLKITFVQSDKRKRDLDNLLSASKPVIDGIAKGMGIDDRLFEPITLERGFNKEISYMRVEIGS